MSAPSLFQFEVYEPTPGLHVVLGHGRATDEGTDEVSTGEGNPSWSDVFPLRQAADLSPSRGDEHSALAAAWRFLCKNQCRPVEPIHHDQVGAPKVGAGEISLSHAWRQGVLYVGLAWTPESRSVGIDVEFPRSILARTAPRVFTPSELSWADSLHRKCLVWTVKESVWKAAGPELAFSEIDSMKSGQPSHQSSEKDFVSWEIIVRGAGRSWWVRAQQEGWVSVGW